MKWESLFESFFNHLGEILICLFIGIGIAYKCDADRQVRIEKAKCECQNSCLKIERK